MRLAALTSVVILFSAGYALAGPGAGESKEPADPPSGRPSAPLDDAKCQSVWSMTQREGDMLSKDKATPFIVNFAMVDTSGDGKITEAEFKEGCKKGWVQEALDAGTQSPTGKPSQP